MIAAIYARKSTEQDDVGAPAKSVTGQIEDAKSYAVRKGWIVAEEHIYVDDATSGAVPLDERRGGSRLVAALKPRPPFQALIMSEESRLGREAFDANYWLKRILTAGVQVWCYLDDREVAVRSSGQKMMLAMTSTIADVERENARKRTYAAMRRRAEAGLATGGRVFGYDNEPVLADGKRVGVRRRVNEAEAEVVRRIFTLYAAGKGFRTIAMLLNEENAPCPVPRRADRLRGWAPSSVREVLYRSLYRGEVVWNRRRKRDDWGTKKNQLRADTEWLHRRDEELRIVSDELWTATHERLQGARAVYLRNTNGQLWGKPANGIESKYLLTGLLRCGMCGGAMTVVTQPAKGGRRHAYACHVNRFKGKAKCANNLWAPLDKADGLVLGLIEQDLLRPEVVVRAIEKAIAELRPSEEAAEAKRAQLQGELRRLEAELGRLTAAIVEGGTLTTLVAGVKEREARRARLQGELEAMAALSQVTSSDLQRLKQEIEGLLPDWQGALRRRPEYSRQILRKLVGGRLTFTPREGPEGHYYEVTGEGVLGRLLAGTSLAKALVAPTGFEPVFSD